MAALALGLTTAVLVEPQASIVIQIIMGQNVLIINIIESAASLLFHHAVTICNSYLLCAALKFVPSARMDAGG